jgi:hypothetical protein
VTSHKHFERLCALDASGQLDQDECRELQDHCSSCESCSVIRFEMHSLAIQISTAKQSAKRFRAPINMAQRFVMQANRQGIPLASIQTDSPRHRNLITVGVAAGFILGLSFLLSQVGDPAPQSPLGQSQASTLVLQGPTDPLRIIARQQSSSLSNTSASQRSARRFEKHPGSGNLRERLVQHHSPYIEPTQIEPISTARFALAKVVSIDHSSCCSYTAALGTPTWGASTQIPQLSLQRPATLTAGRVFRYEATLEPMNSFFHYDAGARGLTFKPGIVSLRPAATIQMRSETDSAQ